MVLCGRQKTNGRWAFRCITLCRASVCSARESSILSGGSPAGPTDSLRKHLYVDFTGYKRSTKLMRAPADEFIPGFKSVREHGLNMIDASQLTYLTAKAEAASAAGS